MSSPDLILIERLRKENLEQFFTLVRMHLSFVVDINTDDVDSSTDKPKQFRWNFHKKHKHVCTNSSQNNAASAKNNTEGNSITEDGILRLNELIDFLALPENVIQEGIFRRTGSLARQQELRQLLLTGSSLGLDEGKFSVHDCASVLKGFLADLPQPLLMDQYYQTYCTLAAQYPPNAESSETKLLTALQLLLLLLTPSHRSFLQRLLTLLRLVADNEASNRMSPDTLATMFTPHLLCPRKLSPETFHTDAVALSPVISFMIRQSQRLFAAPAQLVTDAGAYFTARERRRQSTDELDESITDKTAANTVYTFVDRHRTRVENETNPTDTALAQLYAHIQALPDSQHKRRLIKHFNRQNGYGTPIQIQRTGKVAGSRSFGDSIKRHIFNKGLLNKTPKKGSGSAINAVEEKSPVKGKLRFTDDAKMEVSHKNIVLKNLANKIASTESLDANEDYESDTSNESTLSDGALNNDNRDRKVSPKFVSEPNLSLLEAEDTPKVSKKRTRLFRSKLATQVNKKYQKRNTVIRGTPTSCVSCFDDQDTGSETDVSIPEKTDGKESPIRGTPTKNRDRETQMQYLTSTPGMSEVLDEDCLTPYSINFRRASMSPITKSTQKLSKAMQESIMTPRSRKPLIITCEQRDSLPETSEPTGSKPAAMSDVYESMSPKNDSDFVSSDDDILSRSSYSVDRSQHSGKSSQRKQTSISGRSNSIADASLRSENTRFVLSRERPNIDDELNTTLCEETLPKPDFKISEQVTATSTKSLTEPFREYLLSRSVLTATPIDLSILNKSTDTDDRLTDSLMYCLDGNVPSDLTSSIGNLAVDKNVTSESKRSPLKYIDNYMNDSSPKRKRSASISSISKDSTEIKKALVEKENCSGDFQIRETEL